MDLESLPDLATSTPLWLALLTTGVGAVQGALVGRRGTDGEWDIVGVAILAFCLGLGGGIMRDLLIGNLPVASLRTPWYAITVAGAVVMVMVVGRRLAEFDRTILVFDALTLGLYSAIGTQYALDFGMPFVGAVLVGTVAGTGGGVLVALLQGVRPEIMTPGPPYALVALAGSCLFAVLAPVDGIVASFGCVLFVLLTRFLSVRWGIRTAPTNPAA